MDDRFYRDRARVLRELADEADPLVKRRLLRLADDYDGMTITQATCGQEAGKAEQNSNTDSFDGN
jgi:hypothetical protein